MFNFIALKAMHVIIASLFNTHSSIAHTMILLQNLTLRNGSQVLFNKANVQIHPTWRVGLTGVNGAGKSSLFGLLMGNLPADAGNCERPKQWQVAHMAQEVTSSQISAIDFVLQGDAQWWQLYQDIYFNQSLSDHAMANALQLYDDIGGYTTQAKAATILDGLGVRVNKHEQPVESFSGGWRMRINLARTLMCRSDLLLLDEPTNHLDLDAILWLEQWLNSYSGTLLIISHDRDFLDNTIGHILHIENQTLTLYTGDYTTFERTRAQRLAQQQQAFEKQQATKAHLQLFIDRFKAKATKAKQAQSRIKQLERMQDLMPAHVDSPFTFGFYEPSKMSSPLLVIKHANIGYNGQSLLQNVNLHITKDTRIGLLGLNGAGKSTLIKSIIAELPLLQGDYTASEHMQIGYFAQHQIDTLDEHASPMLLLKRLAPKEHEANLRAFLGGFGFSGERMDTLCGKFSGGERARLALALIVWQRPNFLILDEPTNHLDLEMRSSLCMALQNYEGAILLVSHDRQLISSVCDEFLLLHQGQCTDFSGDTQAYIEWLKQARQDIIKAEKAQSKHNKTTPKNTANTVEVASNSPHKDNKQTLSKARKLQSQLEGQINQLQLQLKAIVDELNQAETYKDPQRSKSLAEQQKQLSQDMQNAEDVLLETLMQLEQLEKHPA